MDNLVPLNDIGGTAEVAQLLVCPKQQVYALRRNSKFPAPIHTLSATPLWRLSEVQVFKDSWKRRPKSPVADSANKPVDQTVMEPSDAS